MLNKSFIPTKPFANFKWQWASVQCTESLNDPVILLGVLSKMRKLEGIKKYSSPEFSQELLQLQNDVGDSIKVNLAGRTGERNLIRNSSQYWKAVGLIDDKVRGTITLTPFGRKVADHEISQAEFAAVTIKTLTLPNHRIQNQATCNQWTAYGISIKPLMLILNIIQALYKKDHAHAHLTANELIDIIIPLSAHTKDVDDFANFIIWNREGKLNLELWPNCCPAANDKRMAREFLLFLSNYGYIVANKYQGRFETQYQLMGSLTDEITEISQMSEEEDNVQTVNALRNISVIPDIERKRVLAYRLERPFQQTFRKNILESFGGKCILTDIAMPEVLEAAHIKPVKYCGNDDISNGLCMRLDIHQLFDTGHIRIAVDGNIYLSKRTAEEYGTVIPNRITIPSFVSREQLKWRWDNYNGI